MLIVVLCCRDSGKKKVVMLQLHQTEIVEKLFHQNIEAPVLIDASVVGLYRIRFTDPALAK